MSSTKTRNFVTMYDGTEIDILYYMKEGEDILFATKDGIYQYCEQPYSANKGEFFKLGIDSTGEVMVSTFPGIKTITIDERVEFIINTPGCEKFTILASPDATASEIGLAIIKELDITWERKN